MNSKRVMKTSSSDSNKRVNDERVAKLFNPNGSKDGHDFIKKRLACSNCRRRRKKCDLGYPCGDCQRLNFTCNINEEDLRKKRHSSTYVQSLEAHISYLETNLQKLVQKMNSDNSQLDQNKIPSEFLSTLYGDRGEQVKDVLKEERIIDNNKIQTIGGSRSNTDTNLGEASSSDDTKVSRSNSDNSLFENTFSKSSGNIKKRKALVKGSLYPEGPVSYQPKSKSTKLAISSLVSDNESLNKNIKFGSSLDELPNASIITDYNQRSKSGSDLAGDFKKERISDLKTTIIDRGRYHDANLMSSDPNILKSLSNFYKWLYPGHFIFVHRESFLYGFFNDGENNYEGSHYCSKELVYAMCAIGSRLSSNLEHMSEIYYEKSKESLLKIVFDENNVAKITTVQALFCLAFYELGKGNNQIAWYFSGLAVRVGYDMGFQLNPEVWYVDDINLPLTKSEVEIRSRIYWGCYIADHFICLMLGRTSTLNVSNSTIPESDELPEVIGTEEFRFASKHILQISLPLKNLIILSRIVEIFTSKIFIETEDTALKVQYLIRFNSQVANWRQSLPAFLKWSKDVFADIEVSTDPTLSHFWYYYYIVGLNFNKPFIEDCDEAKIVVLDIIEDLKTLFNNFFNMFHSFHKVTLYQLYTCLLAIKCLKKLKELPSTPTNIEKLNNLNWDQELKFFTNIFYKEMSKGFELPKRLEEDTEFEIEQEKQAMNQVNNNTHTYDFSLSNEIDDLIKELFDINGEFRDPNINFTAS